MKRSPLRRISTRRLAETWLYRYRCQQFLLAHPYCQVWLAEHGVAESTAILHQGQVKMGGVIMGIPFQPKCIIKTSAGEWTSSIKPTGSQYPQMRTAASKAIKFGRVCEVIFSTFDGGSVALRGKKNRSIVEDIC